MIGETILHYKIIEKLGEGGMGVVYLAEDTKLKRQVAIKFLPHNISTNEEERKRFEIEAQAAAALNHPNIATIYAIEESDGHMFIVMEYIDGKELKDKIKSGPIPTKEAINIAIQIAEGLEAAHRKRIIHRDIKSQNIMITDDGKVKIMDFGLAKVKGGIQLTQMGSTVGTIAYMSPEQAKGEKVDILTDIWSFGVLLYEMIARHLPFKGDYDQAIIYSILNEKPEPILGSNLELQQIITKSLSKDPDERYQSAGEIVEKLHKIKEFGNTKAIKKQSKLSWIIAGSILVFIIIAFIFFMPSLKVVKEKNIIKTIAVLPFVNMSSDANQEYFSEGLSEELINTLSKNPKLQVTARTSSFYFKGKQVSIKTIAHMLDVKNILEGSVRKSENNLRISADLVNAETDATLWSNTYEGRLKNIFALQDSITVSVAKALDVTLLGKEAPLTVHTTDPQAYNDYLLGNYFTDLRNKEDLERAVGYYNQALSIDSTYVQAWVGLSKVNSSLADNGYVSVTEGYNKAKLEIDKALKFNPNLADALSQMGWIKKTYYWDWKGAEESYKRALEIDPNSSFVINGTAVLSFALGRFSEAISLQHRSIEIDPLRINGYSNLGLENWYAGFPDEAIKAFRKCLELDPQLPYAHKFIGLVYLEEEKLDSALVEMEKENSLDGRMYGFAIVYHSLGREKESDNNLSLLIKGYQKVDAFQIAEVYAYQNKKEKAFEWLEKAYDQRDGGLTQMKGDPLLHNIENDPRYVVFMKKMKLPL